MYQSVKVIICSLLFIIVSSTTWATVITFDSEVVFLNSVSDITIQDWSSFEINTLLDNQTLDDITYLSTSGEELVVGSPHGASWLLGYLRGENRYASFSGETISFEFSEDIQSFGISLSQGNQSQGIRYTGFSLWSILVDGLDEYIARVDYGLDVFSGEGFFGLTGLGGASKFEITRIASTAPIVWNIRDIAYESSTPVPEPSTVLLLGSGLMGLAWYGRKRKKA